MANRSNAPILELRKVSMAYATPSGERALVLADIDLAMREGEILGLLGRSGSGKSTLLRIASGLVAPTSGEALYRGTPLQGPAEGVAMVFQTFALFPWLTVLENVEAGLDALGLSRDEARQRALTAIALIGLEGRQEAYPRELSGGMRQRVGFARAIAAEPSVLLMDEPFSALDVLTAETLRTDFLDLWTSGQFSIKSVLMVTHNIEEAVLMCDRVLLLSANPARIAAEIIVPLPHPRSRLDDEFRAIADEIHSALTARATAPKAPGKGLVQPLPKASVHEMIDLLEVAAREPYNGQAKLLSLARSFALRVEELVPIAEALHILEFGELDDGTFKLTAAGRVFANAGAEERRRLFKEHLLRFVPLAAHIFRVLAEREGHAAPRLRFQIELEDHLSGPDAERSLRSAANWSRFAGLFAYHGRTRVFSALPQGGR